MTPDPVNTVVFSESGRQLIIENCVLCGETHRHGSKDPGVARGDLGHRVAHCSDRMSPDYYLELTEDADLPDWWQEWATHVSGGDG